jgi:fluoride exporter
LPEPEEHADASRNKLPIDPDLLVAESPATRRDPRRHRRAQRTIVGVIACAGVVGALARYVMSRLIPTPSGHFPWSTFWINITGSLVIGFVLVLLTERFPRARVARPLIATGFLGAYTTFSTYMVDADTLLKGREFITAFAYAGASLILGGLAAFFGVVSARFVIRLDHRLNEQLS